MSFEPRVTPAAAQGTGRVCPFCGARTDARICEACGRDTNAPRRPCPSCKRMVPSGERFCWSCGAVYRSEMWWKIPLIVFLFLLAFVISILLALVR